MPNSKSSSKPLQSPKLGRVAKKTKKPDKRSPRSKQEGKSNEVQVELEFFNMNVSDFHPVKQFLNVVFGLKTSVCTSELASLITDELSEHVGTTAKSDGEQSDAYAFASIVPMQTVPTLYKFCGSLVKLPPLNECAVLFHERFLNLPSPVAYQLYVALKDDFEHAKSEEPLFRHIKHLIFLTPTIKTKSGGSHDDEYPEAELLAPMCTSKGCFKVESAHEGTDSRRLFSDEGVEKWRHVYVMPSNNFTSYLDAIEEYISV